ncbi:MAG: BrnT family toxin [Planctomycetota bacterium]
MTFEWDPDKAERNLRKHGVSFEEAKTVFTSGLDFVETFDSLHSGQEDRWIAVGPSKRRLLWVVFVDREDDVIRIVGARRASTEDRGTYERWMRGKRA